MSQQPKNPWTTLEKKVVYKNAWITVTERQVITPRGNPGIYGVVESKIATAVIALTEDDEVYLIGQYRYPVDEYSWELVEGGAEHGEDPMEAAKRELREEAGLIAENWIELGPEAHLSNCFSSEIARFYLATGLRETEKEPDETELLEVRKVPFDELVRMVDSGEVKDAMTIIATYRALRLRQKK